MSKSLFYAAVIYLCFVVYGSLVPLVWVDVPLTTAIQRFQNIRYLDLGMESRADWIANILLYIPLAYLWSAILGDYRQPIVRLLWAVLVFGFCLTIAVAIEYSQIYFPPRTVSINDLIAETLGSGIGIIIWFFGGGQLIRLFRQITLGRLLSVNAGIIAYLSVYLVLSLFPYDFVTSFAELEIRLASDNVNWLVSWPSENGNLFIWLVKFSVEILILMPLGYLLCLLPHLSKKILATIILGFLLGLFIESVQIFLVSGVAQGLSVFSRAIGMGLGAVLFQWVGKQKYQDWQPKFRPIILASILPYLFLVFAINGVFGSNWLSHAQAMKKLAETNFLPLYYFYYTTETIALTSLLSNLGCYLPVGLLFWLYVRGGDASKTIHWLLVGLTAAVVASLVETGKLYSVNKHVDPTDVLIAFAAAAGTYMFFNQLAAWLNNGKTRTVLQDAAKPEIEKPPCQSNEVFALVKFGPNPVGSLLSLPIVVFIVWILTQYPVYPVWLGAFLFLYGLLLYRLPYLWLLALPALLPIMDFTLWTGWFFFDEFDLLVLVTLAVYFLRKPITSTQQPIFSKTTKFLISFFGVCYFISLCIGLLPFMPFDANAFSDYFSNYNSLRVAKGMVWAFLLLPMFKQTCQSYVHAQFYFGYGVIIGLTGVFGFAIIERLVFPGLLDFSTDYRINALFSTMHTGGGHIESYLALSLPCLALLFIDSTYKHAQSWLGIILFAVGLYVLLVTFSRGGYIGLAIGFVVLMLALAVRFKNQLSAEWKPYFKVLLLIAIIPIIAIPVLQGELIQQRFSVAGKDKDIRLSHWQDAINMMDADIFTSLFGMGLGSYPRTSFWLNNEDSKPATYRIESEGNNRYLRLRGGDPLYFGQYIATAPQIEYRLVMNLRANDDKSGLNISICEKSIQYSFNCIGLQGLALAGKWTHFEQTINTNNVGEKASNIAWGLLGRPVQITLQNGNGVGKLVDVDNIALLDMSGRNLIDNGDFSKGTDYWFFATEKHNPWHIFNIWAQVLFDTGWLGLLGFTLILVYACYKLCLKLRTNSHAALSLAAISGFLVIGFVDSPFDAPRLTFLFWMHLFFAYLKETTSNAVNARL